MEPGARALPGLANPPPTLRRRVTVASDIVRIGDLIDNAGALAAVPVFRSPDVGTTGSVPARKVIEAARAHNLFGVDTGDVVEVEVSRAGRAIGRKDIEARIARLFADTNGLGDAANLAVTFDREVTGFYADSAPGADLKAMRALFDPRSGRFDVVFEVPIGVSRRTLMRYTGTLVETADAVVPAHAIDARRHRQDRRSHRRTAAQGGGDRRHGRRSERSDRSRRPPDAASRPADPPRRPDEAGTRQARRQRHAGL